MFPDLTRDDVFRLETRRLWLRWTRLADAQAIVRLAGEKSVADMTAHIPHPYTPQDAERFIFAARQSNADGQGLQLAITPKGRPNALIGMVGITPGSEKGQPTLGYWLGTPSWGQGYATEAVRALIDAFFAYGDEMELRASTRVINPTSRRVLEKCGFAYQGTGLVEFPARGGFYPADEFRLDRRAWESLKSWGHTGLVREPAYEAEPVLELAS
ncbi:GNAT family N-acetyltransferase [Microvirga pudoricolor]|uniref:GNAT family N-acetyltransferase n=1 Tax=Microvirga pudoricolor TaxID=2778729 RepID=UPI00195147D9|nr:GNAT family N-acetyltransferase [Microvirga pudoricolor]MBM6595437.1 GNAT family N-acetyltransferase [Microvirga pudoricolor]